jgi:glycosyltransferase involved in cell wall biosynthesis
MLPGGERGSLCFRCLYFLHLHALLGDIAPLKSPGARADFGLGMTGKKGLFDRDAWQAFINLKPLTIAKRQRSRRHPGRPDWVTTISVIIPAHNEEDYLGLTLDAINRQNYPWFEVIVVANGCTDRTAAIAQNHCHRLIVLSNKSLGVARNLGGRLARGDLLLFLDADTLLEPGALEAIAHKFTRPCAAGTIKGCPDSDRFAFRLIYWVKNLLHGSSLHAGSSGVILCWKKHFLAARGFDEALQIRENSDLIRRLKRFGRYRYIGQTAATTSMRRYERSGTRETVWFWFKLWLQSLFVTLRHKNYEAIR